MADHTRDDTVAAPPRDATGWDADREAWDHATLRRAVVHGVGLFNDGAYHESHDCFEAEWFQYGAGTTESAFLHGMTQVAAGAYKYLDHDEPGGMRSLFRTALQYLADVPDEFYGVDVDAIRGSLERGLADPETIRDWRIPLAGATPTATDEDHRFAEGLE